MNPSLFSLAFEWVLVHGYLMIFLAMIIGGPIFISAAAFAAALGYFNVFIVFFLSLIGELGVDILFYSIGYLGRLGVVEKYGRFFGLSPERIVKLENLLHEHVWKTLITIKLSPFLPAPGFIVVGASKMRFKKFFLIILSIGLPKSLFFTLIGFYFGKAYDLLARYFNYGQYLIIVVIVLFIGINYLIRRFSKNVEKTEDKK